MNSTCSFIPRDFLSRSIKLQTLGEGTFGTVALYDTPTGRLVVKETKLQHKSLGYPPDFLNEVDMLIKLKPIKSVVSIHSLCFDNDQRRGYILLEPLEFNLSKWSRKTSFKERMRYLCDIISMVGGAIGIMHHFSLVHNDIKTNNILVDTINGGVFFKLADFGKSFHVTNKNIKYGGIDRYRPPEETDIYTSELWGFMVSLVEVIIGGSRMVRGDSAEDFYSEYKSISSRGQPRFDLPRFLRGTLTKEEINMIPRDFWTFVEPIVKGQKIDMTEALQRIGISLNMNVIRDVNKGISRASSIHPDFRIIERRFREKFKQLDLLDRFDRFSKLLNKFLSLITQRLKDIDLLYYAEVAFIIIVKKNAESFEFFRDQDTFLLFQRAFLVTIGYQISIV